MIPSSSAPAILGFLWLARHNPQIDWASGSLRGWSNACHARCLRSVLPPTSSNSDAPPLVVDLTAVPEVYHDIGGSPLQTARLHSPPTPPYDCAIDLLPRAPLPSSWLYSISRPKREAVERYLSDSMAAGLIRPSPLHRLLGAQCHHHQKQVPPAPHKLGILTSPPGTHLYQAGPAKCVPPHPGSSGG